MIVVFAAFPRIQSSSSSVSQLTSMISYVTSILKIVLGSLIAEYFDYPFIGGWWAGGLLLIVSILGVCSFSGFMLALNIALNFLAMMASLYAVIVDSLLANYFSFQIDKCKFPVNDIQCFCDETWHEYQDVKFYLQDSNCNNVFVRNPQLLIISAALSGLCLLASLLMFILLALAYSFVCIGAGSITRRTRDYTIIV